MINGKLFIIYFCVFWSVIFVLLTSIVILVVLILISGVLSSAEIALSSSNRNKVKMQAEAGDKKAKWLLAAIDEPSNFFATTQLYITFIAFFSGAYAASSFTPPLMTWIEQVGLPISESIAEPLVFIFITAILTYVALVFGELVPKRIAMQYAIPFAMRAIVIINALSIIALPVVKGLSFSSKAILRLIGIKGDLPEEDITKEEILMIVETGSEHGHIDESEQDMIENIFDFDKITAADICTHRLDVVALPIDADFKEAIDVLTVENYTRIPVYEESIDNTLGILHSKDMMHYMVNNPDTSDFDIKKLLREPYFVPFSKKTHELLKEMRKKRVYMAIVIDEHGGTLGVVTMEDLVEEIVGSIQDEYDVDELPDIVTIDENTFRIQGTADLEVVQELLNVPLPIDEYDTLSGFLMGQLGHIPAENEKPEIDFNGLLFKVESVQEKRIATVTVIVTKSDEEAGDLK